MTSSDFDSAKNDLYQELILNHARHPHGYGAPAAHTGYAHHENLTCGDEVTIYLEPRALDNADVKTEQAPWRLRFTCVGCLLCRASASLLVEHLSPLSMAQQEFQAHQVLAFFNGPAPQAATPLPGHLAALMSMRAYPVRFRCITLAWEALLAAITSRARS